MGAGREVPTLSASKILFGHLGYGVLQIHYPKLGKNGWEQTRKMGGERETVLGLCKPWDFFFSILEQDPINQCQLSYPSPPLQTPSNSREACIKWLTLIVPSSSLNLHRHRII